MLGLKFCRDSFVSGKAVAVASLTDIRHLSNKVNRKAIDEAVAGTSARVAATSSGVTDSRRQLDIVISTATTTPSLTQVRKEKIAALRDAIQTMKELDMPPSNEQYKGLLVQLLQEQQALIAELVTPQPVPTAMLFETPST